MALEITAPPPTTPVVTKAVTVTPLIVRNTVTVAITVRKEA